METTWLKLAGLTVRADHPYQNALLSDAAYTANDGKADLCVTVTEADVDAETERTREQYAREGKDCPDFSREENEFSAVHRKIATCLPSFGALVFHGSAVSVDGFGYLFTAKSGVGKTTHTRLWQKRVPGTVVVNGDKPILRVSPDGVEVCGSPWNGKEHLGSNIAVPLRAICIVERAETNEIKEISSSEALLTLLEQTFRAPEPESVRLTLRLLQQVAGTVRFYRLRCNMDDEAADVSWEGMRP